METTTTVTDKPTTTTITDKPKTTTTPSTGCKNNGCPGTDQVCDITGYENCNYCDVADGSCKPGKDTKAIKTILRMLLGLWR